jgi:hypothetical protein
MKMKGIAFGVAVCSTEQFAGLERTNKRKERDWCCDDNAIIPAVKNMWTHLQ